LDFNKPVNIAGNLGVTGTVDGVDIQTLNTIAGAALPKAGGTMTGVIAGFESTGIDDNATDTVITVQQNGNVGIGIDGPGARLTLGGTAGAADNSSVILIALGATQKTYFGTANATGNIIAGSSSGDTVLRSNGDNILFSVDSGSSSAVYIKSDGNVGIGTTNPGATLDLRGHIRLDSGGSTSRSIYFRNQDTSATGGGQIRSDQHLSLWAGNGGGSPTQYVTIKPGGNVGIGTTSPDGKLTVALENSNTPAFRLSSPTSSNDFAISSYNDSNGTYVALGVNYLFDVSGNDAIMDTNKRSAGIVLDGRGNGRIQFLTANSGIPNIRMTILKDGNVGIGTTTPTEMLHIFNNSQAWNAYARIRLGTENSSYEGSLGYHRGTTDDADRGLYLSGSGTTKHVNVRYNGSVGIGNNIPAYKLDVGGTTEIQGRFKSSGGTGWTQGAIVLESNDSLNNPGNRGQGVYMYNVPNQRTWYSGTLYNNGNKFGIGYQQAAGLQHIAADNVKAKLVIDGDTGNVGIGTTSPSIKLHVNTSGGTVVKFQSTYGYMGMGPANSSYAHHNTDRGTYYFPVACQASGGFSTYSDSRLKENVEPVTGALDKVAIMNGVTFTWDNSEKAYGPEGKQFGVLAQNMLEVDSDLPSLKEDALESQENIDNADIDTQYYTMDYSRLTPFFIEAIKELKTKLEAAEARLAVLEG